MQVLLVVGVVYPFWLKLAGNPLPPRNARMSSCLPHPQTPSPNFGEGAFALPLPALRGGGPGGGVHYRAHVSVAGQSARISTEKDTLPITAQDARPL